jgi:hypothetical protein
MKCYALLTALLVTSLLGLASCNDSGVPLIPLPDTTSHNFTWRAEHLGDGIYSVLHDIAIINDSLAYAAGEVYMRDSLGDWDVTPYNMMKWDGTAWTLVRIQFYTICGQSGWTPYPARSLWAFGGNDVWIAMDGSQVARWNGNAQTSTVCLPVSFSIKKLWGESPNSVYAVGDGGNILHYTNGTWQKSESWTTLPIQDIWGAVNSQTGSTEIYAVASNTIAVPSGKKLLRIAGTQTTAMSDSGLNVFLSSLWFSPGGPYYVVGGGFFYSQSISQSTIWQGGATIVTNYYSNAIRGNATNDIFMVGAYGDVVHYNGSTWKSFQQQTAVSGNYWAIGMKGNLVIVVGSDGDRAAVAIGRRM